MFRVTLLSIQTEFMYILKMSKKSLESFISILSTFIECFLGIWYSYALDVMNYEMQA